MRSANVIYLFELCVRCAGSDIDIESDRKRERRLFSIWIQWIVFLRVTLFLLCFLFIRDWAHSFSLRRYFAFFLYNQHFNDFCEQQKKIKNPNWVHNRFFLCFVTLASQFRRALNARRATRKQNKKTADRSND